MPYFDETTGPQQAKTNELQADAYQEALILSARYDSLGGLIRAQGMTETQRLISNLTQGQLNALIDFLSLKASQADEIISDAIASEPRWAVRRKARNVQRRLIIAILCRQAEYTLEELKGAKYKFLLNLARRSLT